MATAFQIVGTRPGTAFLGGTNTQPVVVVEAQTLPDLVYYEVNVAQVGYTAGLARAAAIGIATIINTILSFEWVAGVSWSQGPGSNQELQDMLTITVVSTSGNSTASLAPIAITSLGPQLHEPQINALHEQLDDTEDS
jgi:hypothetical protein